MCVCEADDIPPRSWLGHCPFLLRATLDLWITEVSLFRSAATVSSFTLLSRISGLARDVLVARAFGAGPITDAFWVAFRIPNLLRRLFAEGAFAQAFVPILGAARNNRSDNEVRTLLDRVALLLTLALMLVTLVGIVAAPWVVSAMASGLRGAARDADSAPRSG